MPDTRFVRIVQVLLTAVEEDTWGPTVRYANFWGNSSEDRHAVREIRKLPTNRLLQMIALARKPILNMWLDALAFEASSPTDESEAAVFDAYALLEKLDACFLFLCSSADLTYRR